MHSAVPSGTPQNLQVANISSTTAFVSWEPPFLQHRNGYIVSYLLNYTALQTGEEDHVITSNTSQQVVGLRPFTKYLCSVSAATSVGQGPFSLSTAFETSEDG